MANVRRMLPLTLVVFSAFAADAQAPLKSPWDLHPVHTTKAQYDCPVDVVVSHDMTMYDYYSDSKHSIIDETRHNAYLAAAAPFQSLMKLTEAAADEFQKTGSTDAARCVEHQLFANAKADAMTGAMAANQAYYVQGWTLGAISIAMLKVRTADPGTAEERAVIAQWLMRVAASTHKYYQDRVDKGDAQNNHLYWAGLSVLAAAIVANDRPSYAWGIGTYKTGVDAIQPDGTLTREMERGQRALHYHLYALEPLVMLAEYGEANGERLYTYRNTALKLLVARCLSGMLDPSFFFAQTKEKQVGDYVHPSADDISWAVPYTRRYPDAALAALIAQAHTLSDLYAGGLPPA